MTGTRLKTVWRAGRRRLLADPAFAPLVRTVGPVRLPPADDLPFAYLVRAIVYQQLAGSAARTIHSRVVTALEGDVTPGKVLRVREATLLRAGLSANKLAAIRDLARKVRDGSVELDDVEEQPDEEVVQRLVRVRGIGPWTAQMYLMFRLHRPDVWPSGDLGVRQGYARLHGLSAPLTERDMAAEGDAYRPWRSAAAWYCWRALEVLPAPDGRGGRGAPVLS